MMTMRQIQLLGLAGATVAGAYALRLLWVEDSALGFACAADMTALCALRQGLILSFHFKAVGLAALILGGLALWRGGTAWTALALAASACALVLYNTDLGSLAAVLALTALARLPRRGPGRAGQSLAG